MSLMRSGQTTIRRVQQEVQDAARNDSPDATRSRSMLGSLGIALPVLTAKALPRRPLLPLSRLVIPFWASASDGPMSVRLPFHFTTHVL